MSVRKKIRDIILKELQISNPQEEEHIRIELYKKLQEIATTIKLKRDNFTLNLSGLNEVLSRYGYKLAWDDISIPIIKESSERDVSDFI